MARATAAVSSQAMQMARAFETSTHSLMMSLVEFLGALAAVDGPKTLVFVRRVSYLHGHPPGPADVHDRGRALSVVQVYTDPAARRARSRKCPRDVSRPGHYREDVELQLSGLQDLSVATGGNLLRLSGLTPEGAVARIERETSAYYLLGFEPTPGERDGKSHTIEVKVQRAGHRSPRATRIHDRQDDEAGRCGQQHASQRGSSPATP